MSLIVTADSKKIGLSNLRKVLLLIFLIRQTPFTRKLCPANLLSKIEPATLDRGTNLALKFRISSTKKLKLDEHWTVNFNQSIYLTYTPVERY